MSSIPCRPLCLLASCPLVLLPVSPLCSPLCSSGGTVRQLASALFAITVGVRMSCGCHATAAACSSVRLRSACVHRPVPSTRLAGRRAGRCRCLLLSVPYCLPLSLACEASGSCLLACSYGRRSVPSCCMLCADFVDRVRCGCRGCFAMIY